MIDVLWRSSWQAAVLAMLVLAAQWILRSRLSARWRYNLWLLVLLRLVVPVTPASPWSVFNLAPRIEPPAVTAAPTDIPLASQTAVTQGVAEVVVAGRQAPAAPAIRWKLILASVWIAGVVLFLGRITFATARLIASTRRMRNVDSDCVITLFDRCRVELHITRQVRLLVADDLAAPALMGILRPRLLLPRNVIEQFRAAELRLILLHELAHLKRHDVAINWLVALLQAIHWFNPVLWLAFARMRSDRELACDEVVLVAAADHATYGHTIVKLLESLPAVLDRRAPSQAAAVGILERAHPMRRRITMIAQFPHRAKQWTLLAALCMIGLAGFGLTDAVRGGDDAFASDAHLAAASLQLAATTQQVTAIDIRDPAAASAPPTKPAAAPSATDSAGTLRVQDGTLTLSPATRRATSPTSEAESLYQLYQTRLPEIRFDEIPFSDVVVFLRDVTKNNIVVNWRALEEEGIDPDSPVSLQLHDVTFEQMLRHLCRNVGGGATRLGFTTDAGAFVLSTEQSLATASRARAYNVAELIERQSSATPAVGLEQVERGTLTLRPVSAPGAAPATMPATGRSELIELIIEHIAPDTWRDTGGTLGTIRLYNGRLVVSTIDMYHLEIDKLLAELRREN